MNPGTYKGVSFAEYHRWPGANFSKIKLFERSAAHARQEMLHPSEPTDAQSLGTAVHCAVLEPDVFAAEYVVAPDFGPRNKNPGKALWTEFEKAHHGANLLSAADGAICSGISAAVWAHPVAKELLSGGAREVCLVWDDPETGMRCKARIDAIGAVAGWSAVADLKSIGDGLTDATPDGFAKACANYLYHVQARHYMAGVEVLHGELARRFLHIAVEKSPPHGIAVYELSEGALAQAEQQRRRWLRRLAECEASGNWPGYPTHIQALDLPKWAQETLE